MSRATYRALVADDESSVRTLAAMALDEEGFSCDVAEDGQEAMEKCQQQKYDVILSDLAMPQRNGHKLAVELLAMSQRPLIIIATGYLEPKLVKDLMARGVDDVVFKPVNYSMLAAKIRALVDRQSLRRDVKVEAAEHKPATAAAAPAPASPPKYVVTLAELESKLPGAAHILPISRSALDVYHMTSSEDSDVRQISAAIMRDGALIAEVLRLANSSFFNPAGQRIVDVERAVTRIGQKRIGEFALATSALSSLTPGMVPWMDVGLAWRRSLAAGVAAQFLLAQNTMQSSEGLYASAILHDMGRVVLGALYPRHYERMVATCLQNDTTLLEEERAMFPESTSAVLARLLHTWQLPDEICHPLEYVQHDYAGLAELDVSTRSAVELIKVAALIGRLAVGPWEPWDVVEIPPGAVCKRLGIDCFSKIVAACKRDLQAILPTNARLPALKTGDRNRAGGERSGNKVAYRSVSRDADCLSELITDMGVQLDDPAAGGGRRRNTIANCLGSSADPVTGDSDQTRLLVITEARYAASYNRADKVISLPCSYSALEKACLSRAQADGASKGESERAPALA